MKWFKIAPCSALKEVFRSGYRFSDLKSDLVAGLIVALIALPLGMALAIATGVAPQYGLYTVIVAGFLVALLGGSRFQVTGPTAAFVVILVPIVQSHGIEGLLISGLLAGVILIAMGLLGLGRLIEYIPYPVTTGFTTGIALVIAVIQLKDFFGLNFDANPESFFERIELIAVNFPRLSFSETILGLVTLAILFAWPRFVTKRIPAPLIALSFTAGAAYLCSRFIPGFSYASIQSRFGGIPGTPPGFVWPWSLPSETGVPIALNYTLIRDLLPSAFAIAMLGAIESLLSAVVADGMTKTRHDPDAELLALGTGNLITPFFGGIPATGAIARTATNIRYGARSPLAAIFHAVFVLIILMLFSPLVRYLSMASLAALLIYVAYNMAELKHFKHILRRGPRSDAIVLSICFILTVVFDMVIGVSVGMVLAALLFMRQMAALTQGSLRDLQPPSEGTNPSTSQVALYEISGPLFFGAARAAVEKMSLADSRIRTMILDLERVPTIDATGLVAFEEVLESLHKRKIEIIISGCQKRTADAFAHAEFQQRFPEIRWAKNLDEASRLLSPSH